MYRSRPALTDELLVESVARAKRITGKALPSHQEIALDATRAALVSAIVAEHFNQYREQGDEAFDAQLIEICIRAQTALKSALTSHIPLATDATRAALISALVHDLGRGDHARPLLA